MTWESTPLTIISPGFDAALPTCHATGVTLHNMSRYRHDPLSSQHNHYKRTLHTSPFRLSITTTTLPVHLGTRGSERGGGTPCTSYVFSALRLQPTPAYALKVSTSPINRDSRDRCAWRHGGHHYCSPCTYLSCRSKVQGSHRNSTANHLNKLRAAISGLSHIMHTYPWERDCT